jgi:hypothetical protein
MADNKTESTQPVCATSPPAYEVHTSTDSDPNPNLVQNILSSTEDFVYGVRPSYNALRRKYNYSLAFNIFFVLVVSPIMVIGFALVHIPTSQASDATTSITDILSNVTDSISPPAVIPRDSAALPPRHCVTGFTIEELDWAFKNINQIHENKGRVWNAPCNQVAVVPYTDKGLKAEYDYVVY